MSTSPKTFEDEDDYEGNERNKNEFFHSTSVGLKVLPVHVLIKKMTFYYGRAAQYLI